MLPKLTLTFMTLAFTFYSTREREREKEKKKNKPDQATMRPDCLYVCGSCDNYDMYGETDGQTGGWND